MKCSEYGNILFYFICSLYFLLLKTYKILVDYLWEVYAETDFLMCSCFGQNFLCLLISKKEFPPLCQLLFLASFDCKIQIFFCLKNIHLYQKLERSFEVRMKYIGGRGESEKLWKWLRVWNVRNSSNCSTNTICTQKSESRYKFKLTIKLYFSV